MLIRTPPLFPKLNKKMGGKQGLEDKNRAYHFCTQFTIYFLTKASTGGRYFLKGEFAVSIPAVTSEIKWYQVSKNKDNIACARTCETHALIENTPMRTTRPLRSQEPYRRCTSQTPYYKWNIAQARPISVSDVSRSLQSWVWITHRSYSQLTSFNILIKKSSKTKISEVKLDAGNLIRVPYTIWEIMCSGGERGGSRVYRPTIMESENRKLVPVKKSFLPLRGLENHTRLWLLLLCYTACPDFEKVWFSHIARDCHLL